MSIELHPCCGCSGSGQGSCGLGSEEGPSASKFACGSCGTLGRSRDLDLDLSLHSAAAVDICWPSLAMALLGRLLAGGAGGGECASGLRWRLRLSMLLLLSPCKSPLLDHFLLRCIHMHACLPTFQGRDKLTFPVSCSFPHACPILFSHYIFSHSRSLAFLREFITVAAGARAPHFFPVLGILLRIHDAPVSLKLAIQHDHSGWKRTSR